MQGDAQVTTERRLEWWAHRQSRVEGGWHQQNQARGNGRRPPRAFRAQVPNPGTRPGTSPRPVRNRACQAAGEQVKPPSCLQLGPIARISPVHGKASFHKNGPWCQKGCRPLL